MQKKKSFFPAMKWQKVTILVCALAIFPVLSTNSFAQEAQQEAAQNAAQNERQTAITEDELQTQNDSQQATETEAASESSTETQPQVNQQSAEQQEQAAPQTAPRRRAQTGQVVTLSSTIVGNQEQPQVLYIVPWKPVGDSDLENQNIQSQLDIIFGHVERVELRRELLYMKEFSDAEAKTESN